MPQSDGKNNLKRIEFVIGSKSYPFAINPEEYIQDEPSLSTVTQTKGGAWVDDFGSGLPVIQIRGSTGFAHGLGVDRFKELRKLVRDYMNSSADKEFIFHNWTDDESWVVHTDPQGFRLMRNKSNPLLYMYDIRLVCLRPATHPKPTNEAGGVRQTLGSAIPGAKDGSWKDAIKAYMEEQLRITPKLPPIPSLQAVKPLQVTNSGTVHDVSEVQPTHPADFHFRPQVSTLAAQALTRYKQTPTVSLPNVPENTLPGQLQKLEQIRVPTNLLTAFRMVLLDTLAIWEQIQKDETKLPNLVSEDDLNCTIENAHWLAEQLFQQPGVDLSVTNNLRWLARALQYIRNSDLYQPNYAEKVGEWQNAVR